MRDYAERVKALRCCSKIDARNNGCDSCSYEYCGEDCQNLCGYAADAIEELLAAVPHWISAEDALPKKDETVIVYYSWTGQSGTEYRETSLATLDEMRYCGNKLLGWMPLPAPPKEG